MRERVAPRTGYARENRERAPPFEKRVLRLFRILLLGCSIDRVRVRLALRAPQLVRTSLLRMTLFGMA